jgi:integrase
VRRQEKRWKEQEWVRTELREIAPWLLVGESAPDHGNDVVQQLLKRIAADGDSETQRLRRNFLIRGVDAGRKQGKWNLDVPCQTLRAPLPKPTLTIKTFGRVAVVGRLRKALFETLADPDFPDIDRLYKIRKFGHAKVRQTKSDVLAGRVLLAAILFGGIGTMPLLKAIAKATANGVHACRDVMWMEWVLDAKCPEEECRWQRWYPDPVSGALLSLAHRDHLLPLVGNEDAVATPQHLWTRIAAVLHLLPLTSDNRPNSLHQLIKAAVTWMDYSLPPFLAAYAAGRITSTSLPPEAHRRMLSVLREANKTETKLADFELSVLERSQKAHEDLTHRHAIADLRAAVKTAGTKPIAIRGLERFLKRNDLRPIDRRLAEWVRNQCDHRKTRSSIRLTSIYQYLVRIDRRLATAFESKDPIQLSADDYAVRFQQVLDGMATKALSRSAYPLRSFHDYLVATYGVPADLRDMFEACGTDDAVDANLITEAEYLRAQVLLEPVRSGQPSWLARMQKMALMLGFRAKMRRGEVRRLRIGDVFGEVSSVLYVRTTQHGRVKSAAGTRNLNLIGHFPKQDIDALRDFVNYRIRSIASAEGSEKLLSPFDEKSDAVRDRPLFENPSICGEMIAESALFDPIALALKRATSDPSVHFHLLRKGGQNWMLASLMEEELPGCSHFLDPSGALQEASGELHEKLLGRIAPDRRKLWALSVSVGHATPTTTVGSYLHCLDWLLSYALKRQAPAFTTAEISGMTGLSATAIRKARSRVTVDKQSYLFWIGHGSSHQEWRRELTIEASEPAPIEVNYPALSLNNHLPIPMQGCDVIDLLFMVLRKGIAPAVYARKIGVTPEMILPWIDQARRFESVSIKSPAARKRPSVSEMLELERVSSCGIDIRFRVALLPRVWQTDERQLTNKLAMELHVLACEDRLLVANWLNVYWANWVRDTHEVEFYALQQAKQFLDVLIRIVGQEKISMRYRLAPLKTKLSVSPHAQASSWAAALGIDESEIEVCEPMVRQMEGDRHGKISLSLAYISTTGRETLRKKQKGYIPKVAWQKKASSALESAAYVTTIWMATGLYEGRIPLS